MSETRMSPVLKWAGGKTQLLDSIALRMPKTYNRYYEPFIGGGAVLLSITPEHAFINDINKELINLYRQIKENANEVLSIVNELDAVPCSKDFYYSIRERYNKKISAGAYDTECAALMIWINKHCFNGLYRVNRNGLFNVPYNNKVYEKSVDEANIISV